MNTLWERVIATLIGTVAGFVFSIALFYLTETIKRGRDHKKILKSVAREVSFNLSLFASWLEKIRDTKEQVMASNTATYHFINYTFVARWFTTEAFKTGLLYDLLSDETLVGLDRALRTCNEKSELDFSQKLEQWKAGNLPALEMHKALDFHRFMIAGCVDTFRSVEAALKSRKVLPVLPPA